MGFHFAAFSSSVAASTLATVNAISDQVLSRSDNRFNLQERWDIYAAAAVGTDLQRVRINAPSLRPINLPWLTPINDGTHFPTDPGVCDYRERPFRLRGQEQFGIDGYQDNVAAQQINVLVALFKTFMNMPTGNIHTLRGTSSGTTAANAWSDVSITWDDSLESGRYAVVGGKCISATGLGFRIIFPDQVERPGGLCVGDVNERTHQIFRNGGLGKWGEFDSDALPNIEVLTDSAEDPSEIYLDIIKV